MESLAKILQIEGNLTEKLLQSMILEKRLKAKIDQMSGFIEFTPKEEASHSWNEQIVDFYSKLDKFLEKLTKNYSV